MTSKKRRIDQAGTPAPTSEHAAARRARWVWFAFEYVRGLKHKDLTKHRTIVCRFWSNWELLERVTWAPLQREARRRGAELAFAPGSAIGGDLVLLGLVLEGAYRWAVQLDSGRIDAVRKGRAEAAALDARFHENLREALEALRRRDELFDQLGIGSEWQAESGEPVDIEELEDALAFLTSASWSVPESRFPEDREILRGGQGERGRAVDVRRFFARVDSWPGFGWTDLFTGERSTALDCMTAEGISALLCAAAGDDYHDPVNDSLGVEAIGKALQRYRHRPGES